MHMADALLSPAVGGTMWAATAGTTAYCAKKVRDEMDDRKVPLMGVLGAFIFSAQMLNFTIPAAGSSGHLGGGMILAILLGPYAAFIVMASVLAVQALFFADGGLLALGCNIFNLGVFPCFIGLPLYRKLAGDTPSQGRIALASMVSAVVGLQLGAFGVVMETVTSGISELPFNAFVLLMQPIHLAIGVVEGLATAAVVTFVWREQPDILARAAAHRRLGAISIKKVLLSLGLAAVIFGGILSWFASSRPDGLEWSIGKVTGREELGAKEDGVHGAMAKLQEKTAVLPDYGFKKSEAENTAESKEAEPAWPAPNAGTSTAGLVGGFVVMLFALALGWLLNSRNRKSA